MILCGQLQTRGTHGICVSACVTYAVNVEDLMFGKRRRGMPRCDVTKDIWDIWDIDALIGQAHNVDQWESRIHKTRRQPAATDKYPHRRSHVTMECCRKYPTTMNDVIANYRGQCIIVMEMCRVPVL